MQREPLQAGGFADKRQAIGIAQPGLQQAAEQLQRTGEGILLSEPAEKWNNKHDAFEEQARARAAREKPVTEKHQQQESPKRTEETGLDQQVLDSPPLKDQIEKRQQKSETADQQGIGEP